MFYRDFAKRIFDFSVSLFLLLIALPLIIVAFFVATIETRSFGIFVQKRVGLNGVLFSVYKIKTMVNNTSKLTVTSSNDPRITRSGIFFRKYKIDELPQLYNVLIGDMSFVGPRPDVPGYADLLIGEDSIVLDVRPGITGPASIKYKDEELILAAHNDPKGFNDSVIWPDKVRINKLYVQNCNFIDDVKYIFKTF